MVLDVERDVDEEFLEDEDDWLDEDELRLSAAASCVSAVAKASRKTGSSFVIPIMLQQVAGAI